ncbi:MAG: V-type ATP synthase subunit I [Ruminococcus sp.]|nr:V-type ATP synthase subunit I [Ruminococcus sp.]
MAKAKMQRIEIIALLKDSKKIIDSLQRMGTVEFINCTEEQLEKTDTSSVCAEFEKFLSLVESASKVLNNYCPSKGMLESLLGDGVSLDGESMDKASKQLDKSLRNASLINNLSKKSADNHAAAEKLRVRMDTLESWLTYDMPLDFAKTQTSRAFVGTIMQSIEYDELVTYLPEKADLEIVYLSKRQTNIFVLCHKDEEEQTKDALDELGFVPLSEKGELTPRELYTSLEKQADKLDEESEELVKQIRSYEKERDNLELAAMYLKTRVDKYKALGDLGFGERVFVLEGYIPEKYASKTILEFEEEYTAAVRCYEPDEEEDVPVLLENSKFSEPLEGITRMYAYPNKRDVDPTPVMSFFYYLFFGMMLSDAGYGLVMAIGCQFAIKKLKLSENMKKSLTMFRNCGISTMVFGVLFGSFFGDIIQIVAREYFGKEIDSIALWFEPLDDPIKLLLVSFALGIIHLFAGLWVSFRITQKEKGTLDAVLDVFPIYITILGICPPAASILTEVPSWLSSLGVKVALVGAILIVLTSGRTSKSIFGRLFGGIYALYNAATGYLSDILSYSRLLALGLATGSIAGVVNLIGVMPENMVIKTILLVVVFVIGHTANMAINLLGAYVHSSRLQFVEMFSKFYEGGGREFDPLRIKQ